MLIRAASTTTIRDQLCARGLFELSYVGDALLTEVGRSKVDLYYSKTVGTIFKTRQNSNNMKGRLHFASKTYCTRMLLC